MIKITFPDGSVREYNEGVNGLQIAESISSRLAQDVLACGVNGETYDLGRPINEDANFVLYKWDDEEGKHAFWHTSAHLLAEALQELYPGIQFGIGPAIENGFYYDVDPGETTIKEADLPAIEKKMAELVAKEIYNIRESKNALLRGQADNMPSDGAQLKIMLDNLNAQEEAMTQMFSGTRDKEEKTFTVRLTPDREFNNEVAFRFSKKLGVVANNDLAGTPFYISLKDLKSVKIPQEDGKKKKDLDGIAYNVPGQAMVTLTDGKKKLYEGELPITQFGVIEYLAPVLFNKNSTIKVYFDPNTGGLLKVDREEGK